MVIHAIVQSFDGKGYIMLKLISISIFFPIFFNKKYLKRAVANSLFDNDVKYTQYILFKFARESIFCSAMTNMNVYSVW